MPSPSIPCSSSASSSSAPNFSNLGRLSRGGSPQSRVIVPLVRNRPECFIRSLGRKILGKRRTTNNSSTIPADFKGIRGSTLDIISLHEENNEKGLFHKKVCSPYYRGLLANANPSDAYNFPERAESHYIAAPASTITTATEASFASSVIVKIQGCFPFRNNRKEENHLKDHDDGPHHHQKAKTSTGLSSSPTANHHYTAPSSFSFPLPSTSELMAPDMITKESKVKKQERSINGEKKPLRESKIVSGEPAHDNEAVPNLPDQSKISPFEEVRHVDHKDIFIDDQEKRIMNGEREFLWADKYRPKALEDFICNRSKALHLQALVRKGDSGHFIFQGPPGVGKRTMIWAMLREAFGPDSVEAREESKVFDVKGEVEELSILVKGSPRVIEVNLSDLKGREKHVIFELIKETSDVKTPTRSPSPCNPSENCRAIIFNIGLDKLSTDTILYIKWLYERYRVCSQIFFCCTDVSKLQAIKDICTVVELLPPSRTEIIQVLKFIAEKEGIELPHQLAEKITDTSKKNLRQAIRSFEATWLKHYPFAEDQQVLTGWEDDIANIAKSMVHEQSPKLLYIIRGKLQNLIEHDVSPDFIFQSLVEELKKHLHHLLKRRVHNLYVEYSRKEDQSMYESDKAMAQRNNKVQKFMRIEEFIAKFMSCYKAESAKLVQQCSDDRNSEEQGDFFLAK